LLVFENMFFLPVDSLPSDMFSLYFGKMKRITIDANFMADFSSECLDSVCSSAMLGVWNRSIKAWV